MALGKKRYGHNSLLGATFIISVDNGCVLDYEVKSKICFVCKRNPDPSEEWKKNHETNCTINHTGSSGSMERDAAVVMFTRSVEKRNLIYSVYVGDGDTNSFGAVSAALQEKFGDEYPITKEDCIGHIERRMGAALRNYKNKGGTLPDGKGGGGTGRLTAKVIDQIQTYYGYAIRNNKGDTGAIIKAIWAIYYHLIQGPTYEPIEKQHSYCPDGKESWCRYQKDISNGTNLYERKKCLPFVFRGELKPIFDRLSSAELLKSCEKGLTQNANESLNNVVWTKCSKRVLVGCERFKLGVCEAITTFNDGAKSQKNVYELLNIKCGPNMLKGLQMQNKIRLQNSRLKVTEKYRSRRQKLRSLRKSKISNKSYISGAFSRNIEPDNILINSRPSASKNNININVHFIDDIEVANWVTYVPM